MEDKISWKPGARSHRAMWAMANNLGFISYAIRKFYVLIGSKC